MTPFKNTPLFGKDSSTSHTSNVFSLIGTVVFWLIFLLCAIFVKGPEKKPKYKEVQIVLQSTPTPQKTTEAPAPAAPAPAPTVATPEATETVQQKSEPQKMVETPAPKEAPAPAPAKPKETPKPAPAKPKEPAPAKKTEPAPKKEAPKVAEKKAPAPKPTPAPAPVEPVYDYARDMTEDDFFSTPAKATKKEFNWDDFDDSPAETTPVQQTKTVKPVENSFSGSAATASETKKNETVTSTSSSSKAETTASTKTTSSLGKIANTTFKGVAVAGVESQVSVKAAASGSGKVMMEMADGTQRALLEPAEPVIKLSEAAAATIDVSKTVTIEFEVTPNGHVPYGDIDFTPASSLSSIVKNEIKDQICQWRFETANFSSIAKFEYRIVKK